LTRVRLRNRLVATTVIFILIALSLLVYRQLNVPYIDFWVTILFLLFLAFLATRARLLKSRVAELVDLAARRAGLQRLARRGKIIDNDSEQRVQVPADAIDSGLSHPS
jgi:hypothetical protein